MKSLKNLCMQAVAGCRLPRFLNEKLYPGTLTIVMYHGVVRDPLPVGDWCFKWESEFWGELLYLQKLYTVLPLSQAVREIRKPLRKRVLAAITFDDGYANNFKIAFPMLKQLELPASIFLNTGVTGTDDTLWFCRLLMAIERAEIASIEWNGQELSLKSSAEKRRASEWLQAQLKTLPPQRLNEEVAKIVRLLDDDPGRPVEPNSPYRMLDEPEIHAMCESGLIEFGAHTHNHTILSQLDEKGQEEEIEPSIREVERLTGRPCKLFAYPNGRRGDYTDKSIEILQSLGVEAAVTTIDGPNDERTPALELRRCGIGGDMRGAEFRCTIHHFKWQFKRLVRCCG